MFPNITLYYANLEGLYAMKLRALETETESGRRPRLNDLADLKTMLDYFGEDDFDALRNKAIRATTESFPEGKKLLQEYLK